MRFKTTSIFLISFCFFGRGFGATGDEFMPLSEIKPGMRGVAKTVFAGTEIEEFELEVLDVIPNFRAKRSLILAKLLGEKVTRTGVVAGMSGSPVYIDGKLIGAISYSMGIFLKDPIAGITPIEQMLEIFDREKVRKEELAFSGGYKPEYLEMALGVRALDWENFIPRKFQRLRSGGGTVTSITPLNIPLIFSGFERAVLEKSHEVFAGLGFEIQQGGGIGNPKGVRANKENNLDLLQPGSAFSVVLVEGDFGLQAAGTVTYKSGEHILGMGHPIFDNGAVGLPMGQERILTTLSSLMFSTKMSTLTEIVGTIHQDRTTGLLGVIGETAKMIPIHMSYASETQGKQVFDFRVAEDRSLHSLTPLILRIVLTNALESARLSTGDQTLELKGKIALKGQPDIQLENHYGGTLPNMLVTDAAEATGDISALVGALLSNNFQLPEIESIDLNFHSLHTKNLVSVQRIELDKTVVRPGESVTLRVTLKEYQGQEHKVLHHLRIPGTVTATSVTIFAGSGNSLTQVEYRTAPQKFIPKNFRHFLKLLKDRRKNNYLFFQIRVRDQGVLVEGNELPSLPPSVLSVMKSQKSSGNVLSLRDRTLFEDAVQVDYSIRGGRTIRLRVNHKDE